MGETTMPPTLHRNLLSALELLKQSRLSVMPITPAEYGHLLKLGGVR